MTACFNRISIRWRCFAGLLWLAAVLLLAGCSGESGPVPVFSFPYPTDLRISGIVNLADVAIHQDLGGITPSLIDLRPFELSIQDQPGNTTSADLEGRFVLEPISIRDQVVIMCQHTKKKNLVLEWMAADSQGLYGEVRAEVSIKSTARSLIARCLRDRYGRRIKPDSLDAQHISTTVDAIADVLEKHPEKLAQYRLDQVPEVKTAYTAMAASLHQGESGVIPNSLVLLLYMAGDNSLATQIADNIEDIAAAGLPSGTQILIQADYPIDGVKRMMITDKKVVELASVGHLDSSSGAVLADFVAWGRRAFPARRYALFISSHSDAWKSAASLRNSLIVDDSAESVGNPIEIAAWLEGANTAFDGYYRALDLLVFDACSMGCIEIAWQFRKCADFTAFSQAFVPAQGLPYGKIVGAISAVGADKMAGQELGKLICNEYRSRYIDATVKTPATISLIKNAGFDVFMPRLIAYFTRIHAEIGLYGTVLGNLRDSLEFVNEEGAKKYVVQAFERAEYRDLKDFVSKARNAMPSIANTTDQLLAVFSQLIVVNHTSSWFFPQASGISITFPDKASYLSDYIGSSPSSYFFLDFCQATLWDEILTAIHTNSQ
ncbi:MAG: hypothetical protein CVV41_20955 [Candidatus Riflebacteria bacterium HGW-Riflebacteria-1]|nr:MAG: hypothetical protein CVV41_20955 [Candidatus Riflebacteria bacterium HGW-Riflebacteria-1]